MAVGLKPQFVGATLGQIHDISNEIWYISGDKSTDINWYTKRALLSKVYVLTELHMIQDKSEDFKDTWEFLDRRLEEVAKFGKAIGQSKGHFSILGGGLQSILSVFSPNNLSMDDQDILKMQQEALKKNKK